MCFIGSYTCRPKHWCIIIEIAGITLVKLMEIATGNLCPISQPLDIIQEIISK